MQPSSTPGGTGLGSATMAAEAAEEDGAKRPEPLELEGSVRENSFGIGSFTRTFSSKHHSPSHSLTSAFSKLARSPSQKEARLHSAREQQRSIRDVVEMREKERKRMARMLIDPRTSSFVNRWDVVTALGSLDLQARAIIVLRDLQGLDYADIAEVLGTPIGTVKSRLFRARAALRFSLEGLGHDGAG